MKCYILDIFNYSVLVEYQDKDKLYRKSISRDYYISPQKHLYVDIPRKFLQGGIDYSNVDLVQNLGSNYNGIQIADLEQACRKAGLWRSEDYIAKPGVVNQVLTQFPGIDTATIIKAATYEGV